MKRKMLKKCWKIKGKVNAYTKSEQKKSMAELNNFLNIGIKFVCVCMYNYFALHGNDIYVYMNT